MTLIIFALFNFIFYSFFGWILENVYCFCVFGKFQEEGFLTGPLKPMYGIAMASLIFLNDAFGLGSYWMILLCFIIPTVVEYASGYMLKKLFSKTYWDYSHMKFNYQGLVNIKNSIYWLLLSLAAIRYLQPLFNDLYENNFVYLLFTAVVISSALILDLIHTVKELIKEPSKA